MLGKEAKIHASIGIALDGAACGHRRGAAPQRRHGHVRGEDANGHGRYALYEPRSTARCAAAGSRWSCEHAVERRELVAHYQPVVSLVDGSIQAFEALVRWPHPERGLLAPSEFIDTAEESGLMFDVGRCVLAEAFRSAQMWEAMVPDVGDIGIWVNLAPSELPTTVSSRSSRSRCGEPGWIRGASPSRSPSRA